MNKKQVIIALLITAIGAGGWVTFYQTQEQQEMGAFSLLINHDRDFLLLEFSGNGSAINPFIIENRRIVSNNSGIRIAYTTSFCIIRNCDITHNGIGIQIEEAQAGTIIIKNNEIQNGFKGVELLQTDNVTVTNNICTTAQDSGISVKESLHTIANDNTCRNNRYGIEVPTSSYNQLFYNLLQENKEYGVSIDNSMLTYSENNHIYGNYFISNYGFLENSYVGSAIKYIQFDLTEVKTGEWCIQLTSGKYRGSEGFGTQLGNKIAKILMSMKVFTPFTVLTDSITSETDSSSVSILKDAIERAILKWNEPTDDYEYTNSKDKGQYDNKENKIWFMRILNRLDAIWGGSSLEY